MPDIITIARAELQQLLELVGIIEEAVEFVDDHIEDDPYTALEHCSKIMKALNKIKWTLTALQR